MRKSLQHGIQVATVGPVNTGPTLPNTTDLLTRANFSGESSSSRTKHISVRLKVMLSFGILT